MDVSKVIDKKIDYWKKKLIDLSKRNNLVRYRFTKSKSLKIISPPFSKVVEDLENEQNIFILKEKKDIEEALSDIREGRVYKIEDI